MNRIYACFVATALAALPGVAAPHPNSAQVLMENMQEEASAAVDDAYHSAPFTPSKLSWEGYASSLESLRARINQMGADLAHLKQMTSMEDQASRQAIAEVEPILRDMATRTQSAILYFNENHNRVEFPAYTDRLKAIEQDSERIAHLLKDAQKLTHVHSQEATLTQELGM